MTDLLPCPFCGCALLWLHQDEYDAAVIECNRCDARGPYITLGTAGGDVQKALAMAAEAWNIRAKVDNDNDINSESATMTDAKKVYLITSGSYSDYTIRAVFSTEELAQQALDWYYPDSRIEEYTLDADHPIPEHGKKTWQVTITVDGDVTWICQDEPGEREFDPWWGRSPDGRIGSPFSWIYELHIRTLAFDEEHAKKIAGEKLAIAMTDGSLEEIKQRYERRYRRYP